MAKEQERKVEPQGIEPRAIGIPCHCSATKLIKDLWIFGMRDGCWWELLLNGQAMARYANGPGFDSWRLHLSFLLFHHFRGL